MLRASLFKVVLATALFGIVHSALASCQAKALAARWFGERQRNGWYRLFFIGQSFFTLAVLGLYLRRLPDRVLYQARGPVALALILGQVAAGLYAVYAAWAVGLPRILGLASVSAWLRAVNRVPPEPEAQGPSAEADGALRVIGPFRWSRHPLNFAPLPIFWLWPRMTARLLAFNLASTLYLVLGSMHEEARLLKAYGAAYRAYQRGSVPFYLPRPARARPAPRLMPGHAVERAGVSAPASPSAPAAAPPAKD